MVAFVTHMYIHTCGGNIVRQWQNKFRKQFRINQNILRDILLSDEQTVIPKTEYDFQRTLEGASPEQRNCLEISRQMQFSMQYGCRVRCNDKRNIPYTFNIVLKNITLSYSC